MRQDASFEAFAKAHAAHLLRTAVLLVGNRTDADDLVELCLTRDGGSTARVTRRTRARRVLARLHIDRWRRLRNRPHAVELPDVATDDPFARADVRTSRVDRL